MNLRKHTIVLSLVLSAVAIVYDIAPAVTQVSGDTISEVIRDFSYRTSTIPFGMGVLLGHWFFPFRKRNPTTWLLCFGMLALVLLLDFALGWTRPYVAVPFGLVSGSLLWGLNSAVEK